MINNQTLISRAEQYLQNNFQYQVIADTTDITQYIKSISIETTALNDETMEPITGQATLVLTGDHRARFNKETSVKIFLKISETEALQIFAGYSDVQTQASFSDVRSETVVKIFDYTNILKKKKITKQVYQDVVFCNHQNQGNSLLHILLSQVGLQNTIAVSNNLKSYPLAVVEEGTLYDAVLQACHSVGCVFDFTSGFFKIVQIAYDTYSSVYTLDKCEKLTVDRLNQEKKNPVVFGYDITQTNQLIYVLTYKTGDSVQECFIPISANGFWPADGKAVAEIESDDIIKIDSPSFSITTASGGSVTAVDVSVEGKKIKFRLKNNTASEQTVIKCRINADVVKITKETRSSETINTGNAELKQEWTNNYLIDGPTSQTLANRIAQRWKAREYKYTIDTYYLPFLEPGDIIQFQDAASNTNSTCFVHALKHYITPAVQKSTVQLINVEAVSTSATSETLLNQTPLNINIVNAQTSVSLQEVMSTLSPQNTQGYSGQGWTTTPQAPVIKEIKIRNNFITLDITPQQELSNFERYEYQISKDNGGTWTNLAGQHGQVEISYLDTWQLIVTWNTDADGKAVDTQVKIRVRRKTKANIYSGWAYTDNLTLQASLSSITNNLGQVYCDSVLFDAYNYIGPSAFRLGGADSYIQYAGGDLNIQGAGMSIAQGNISVSGDITAGGVISGRIKRYLPVNAANTGFVIFGTGVWRMKKIPNDPNFCILHPSGEAYIIRSYNTQEVIYNPAKFDNIFMYDNYTDAVICNTYNISKVSFFLSGAVGYLGDESFEDLFERVWSTYGYFMKDNGIIRPDSFLVDNVPQYYARLRVGETMQVNISWSNSTETKYIPLQVEVGDVYRIDTLLLDGTTNDIQLLNCYNTSPYETITQYFALDPNNGLMRAWNKTTTPRFLTTGFFVGTGGGVPHVMTGYLRIINTATINGNVYYRFSASFQSQVKEWQNYFINSWGWLRGFNYLAVKPSLSHTATILVIITRLQ